TPKTSGSTGTTFGVVTVTSGSGTPTGNVLFTFIPTSGPNVTQTVALVSGKATADMTKVPAGKYTKITAQYQGNTSCGSSSKTATSSGVQASLTVVGAFSQSKLAMSNGGTVISKDFAFGLLLTAQDFVARTVVSNANPTSATVTLLGN